MVKKITGFYTYHDFLTTVIHVTSRNKNIQGVTPLPIDPIYCKQCWQ